MRTITKEIGHTRRTAATRLFVRAVKLYWASGCHDRWLVPPHRELAAIDAIRAGPKRLFGLSQWQAAIRRVIVAQMMRGTLWHCCRQATLIRLGTMSCVTERAVPEEPNAG